MCNWPLGLVCKSLCKPKPSNTAFSASPEHRDYRGIRRKGNNFTQNTKDELDGEGYTKIFLCLCIGPFVPELRPVVTSHNLDTFRWHLNLFLDRDNKMVSVLGIVTGSFYIPTKVLHVWQKTLQKRIKYIFLDVEVSRCSFQILF